MIEPALVAIGDSHCTFFVGLRPKLATYHVGPALAWSLASDNSITGARSKTLAMLRILDAETWALLCFGEIDIRCHVLAKGGPIPCAERYLGFVREAKAIHERIALWAPIATHPTGYEDEDFRTVGSEIERNVATRQFTEHLRNAGVPVASILDVMLDERGLTRPETLADGRHASIDLRPAALDRLCDALGLEIGAIA